MECFVIIGNGFQPLTIITKHSILDVKAALVPPLKITENVIGTYSIYVKKYSKLHANFPQLDKLSKLLMYRSIYSSESVHRKKKVLKVFLYNIKSAGLRSSRSFLEKLIAEQP